MKNKAALAGHRERVALKPTAVLSALAALAVAFLIGSIPMQAQATNPFAGVVSPKPLLVIAPGSFMPAVQPLVQHKNATGMPTVVLSLSSLTAYFPGVDAPERIKRGIQYAHENLGTEYVILVGDAHWFPVRYEFMQGLGSPVVDGDYIPSDLYYANLYHHAVIQLPFGGQIIIPYAFDNWDADGNRKYNEGVWGQMPNPNPDNVDGYPDVAVGRVPAHTAADVTTFVNKVIFYETQTLNHFFFTFVADNNYPGATGDSTGIVANSGLKAFAAYLLINSDSNPPYPFNPAQAVDVANVADASAWVSYVGHGSRQGWDGIGPDLVQDTANNTALPVVFAAGCSTGAYAPEAPGFNVYEYRDVSNRMWHLETASVLGQTWLIDLISGQFWGCPGCKPLPLIASKPNPYDFNEGAFGFAYPWLIQYPRGGAIAYFGEVSVAEDWMGVELETDMLADYQGGDRVLGSIYLTGERAYWNNHQGDVGRPPDFHSQSRYYLGWMVFFGDPSLRMP